MTIGASRRTTGRAELSHGGELHRWGIWAVREYLDRHGWRLVEDSRVWAGLSGERIPDVVADGEEERTDASGRVVRRRVRIVVEVETRTRPAEMARRERWYCDSIPPRADRLIAIPLWRLKDRDSVSALRELVRECLP